MMKAQRVWDYVMRRKARFLMVLAMLAAGVVGWQLLANRPMEMQRQAQEVTKIDYDNGLSLRIPNDAGGVAYQLRLGADFRTATVTVMDGSLADEAYVRIMNATGELMAGDYTEMREVAENTSPDETNKPNVSGDTDNIDEAEAESGDQSEIKETPGTGDLPEIDDVPETTPSVLKYYFTDAPKSYLVNLEPGYRIEVKSAKAKFYSHLTGAEAVNFAPAGYETYVVTENGLRKEAWSEERGEAEMYGLLKVYLETQIQNYQATITKEILNNKNLDTSNKNRVILAYYELREADREPYREFVEHLQRGGVPEISYFGESKYNVGEMMDLAGMISVFDGEDGEINVERVVYTGEVDWNTPGKYLIEYSVADSDGNESKLTVEIEIVDPTAKPTEPIYPGIDETRPGEIFDEDVIVPGPIGGGANVSTPPATIPIETLSPEAGELVEGWSEVAENELEDTPRTEPSEIDNTVTPAGQNTTTNKPVTRTDATPQSPTTAEEKPMIQNIAWLMLGVVAVAGLVKFIFDHYVR